MRFVVTTAGLASLFQIVLHFENQQKKTNLFKKQKQALIFKACFIHQLFVDLFVTTAGFKPATS